MDSCIEYKPRSIDFLIPTKTIFNCMCQSYDKTTLFLVSFLRFLFYLTVAYYTYQFEINIWIKNSLIILAIFNTFIVIYVILKKQKYIKKNEKNKIEIIDGEPEIVYEFPAGYGTPLF